MNKHLFSPLLLCAAMLLGACSGESEYHQTSVLYPAGSLLLVGAEGGRDSLVFLTTESFDITTEFYSTDGQDGVWCTFPDAFLHYTNPGGGTIVEFHVPVDFAPNTSKHQRQVVFNIKAGEYSAAASFIQDTIHAAPLDTIPE